MLTYLLIGLIIAAFAAYPANEALLPEWVNSTPGTKLAIAAVIVVFYPVLIVSILLEK